MTLRQQVEIDLRRWLRSHHGIITFTEALRLGASPRMIQTKLERGEWKRLYRGVYCDTATAPGPWQDLRAANAVTSGFGAVSHNSAAWVWGLVREPPEMPELTIRRGARDPQPRVGLTIHRSRDFDLSKAVYRNSILVTNPLRTLVDVAGSALPGDLTTAVDSALAKQLVTTAGLGAEIDRLSRPGRDGVAVLRRHLLERGFIGAPDPSVLEAHTRRLVRGTGLPFPDVEVRVGEDGEYRLDIAWTEIRFAIEVDGYVWHFSPEHMRRDLDRRNHLQDAGWTLRVYTWRHVLKEPARVGNEITETYRRLTQAG